MLVKEYTGKAIPEGRLFNLFRQQFNYYAKTTP